MIGIELQGDTRALRAIADKLLNLPSRRADRIGSIIKDGVLHNYDVLTMGGSVPAFGGGDVRWMRVRSRMTIAIRRQRGLGALFPILTLTGKLRGGLAAGGVTSSSGGTFSYTPAGSVRALIRTHQYGLQPLPSRSARAIFAGKTDRRVPPREIMFWSRDMARQVELLAKSEARGSAN